MLIIRYAKEKQSKKYFFINEMGKNIVVNQIKIENLHNSNKMFRYTLSFTLHRASIEYCIHTHTLLILVFSVHNFTPEDLKWFRYYKPL